MDSQCDGDRPTCQRCARSNVPCVYEVRVENITRYQSLRADHAIVVEESRQLRDLIDRLASIPAGERDRVLDYFKASRTSSATLALAQEVLARAAIDSGQIPAAFEANDWNNTQRPVSHYPCLCCDLEQFPMDAWERLYDLYWLHYSADLCFLHRRTFLAVCRRQRRNDKHLGAHSERIACCNIQEHGHTVSALLLAFLALTVRHYPDLIEQVLDTNRLFATGSVRSPGLYALSAEQHLRYSNASCSTRPLDSIHTCLLLAMYNCSMARCKRALQLLGEATALVRSMDLDQNEQSSLPNSPALSASLAHELSMMQVSNGCAEACIPVAPREISIDAEIRTRTFWSCYILDSQLQLGKGRRRLLQDKNLTLQQHATDDQYWFDSKLWSHLDILERAEDRMDPADAPYHHNDSAEQNFSDHVANSSTATSSSFWSDPHVGTSGQDQVAGGRNPSQESPLSLYIKASNLLAQISSWALCGGRRCVVPHIHDNVALTSTESRRNSPGMLHLDGTSSLGSY